MTVATNSVDGGDGAITRWRCRQPVRRRRVLVFLFPIDRSHLDSPLIPLELRRRWRRRPSVGTVFVGDGASSRAATTASSARGPCRMGRRRRTPCWRKRTVPTARAAATTLAPPLWDNHASFVRPPLHRWLCRCSAATARLSPFKMLQDLHAVFCCAIHRSVQGWEIVVVYFVRPTGQQLAPFRAVMALPLTFGGRVSPQLPVLRIGVRLKVMQ